MNRTLKLEENEVFNLTKINGKVNLEQIINKTINQCIFEVLDLIPDNFIDLLIVDPPYNLNKKFNKINFKSMTNEVYKEWLNCWFEQLVKKLKNTASVYFCCDWKCSGVVESVLNEYLIPRSRITWEREKGRGANSNWKNCSEDIWYYTVSNDYVFNLENVKLKRKVLAPYKTEGVPKDWIEDKVPYRLTYPSNIWTDVTIPFWSMPENTEHPTQKPEKLIAKLILASSNPNDVIFDPFLGSGTTSVVAKKLGRNFIGVEIDEKYCMLCEKRLMLAETNKTIQGYEDGIFLDRNFK